jgi:hypothetical protein
MTLFLYLDAFIHLGKQHDKDVTSCQGIFIFLYESTILSMNEVSPAPSLVAA